MAKQRGMPLPPDSSNASLLLYSRESQLGFVHWIDATQQLKKRKCGCLCGREVRVLDGRFVYSHASIFTALISPSCLLTWELRWRRFAKRIAHMCLQKSSDFMTCSRSPRRSNQTSKCSCASATSCCVCGHADDEASLATCATCMMNFHKECVETFVQYVVGLGKVSSIHCQCSPLS